MTTIVDVDSGLEAAVKAAADSDPDENLVFINADARAVEALSADALAAQIFSLDPAASLVEGRRALFYGRDFASQINASIDFVHTTSPTAASSLLRSCHSRTKFFELPEYSARAARLKSSQKTLPPRRIAVIGGGMAAAFMVHELEKRGADCVVVDAGSTPGSEASALYAGLCHPHWQTSDNPLFTVTRRGFEVMLSCMRSNPDLFEPTGVLEIAKDEQKWKKWMSRLQSFSRAPSDFVRLLDASDASEILGIGLKYGAIHMPQAGMVYASKLVRKFLSSVKVVPCTRARVEKVDGRWAVFNEFGVQIEEADAVVLAAGRKSPEAAGLPAEWFGIDPLYGRISILKDDDLADLKIPYTGGGYGARIRESGFTAVGATYESPFAPLSAQEAHAQNVSNMTSLIGGRVVVPCSFYEGVRAVARDRLPMAGRIMNRRLVCATTYKGVPEVKAIPAEDGLFGLFALGSRGLTWGLLCAQVVAAQMFGEPLPVSKKIEGMLDPRRHFARHCAAELNTGNN